MSVDSRKMNDNKYVSEMLVGISNAQGKVIISTAEEKRLADDVMDNRSADVIAARLIEHSWDEQDEAEGVNYYEN